MKTIQSWGFHPGLAVRPSSPPKVSMFLEDCQKEAKPEACSVGHKGLQSKAVVGTEDVLQEKLGIFNKMACG